MQEQFEHRGKAVEVWTTGRQKGPWNWAYRIDSGAPRESRNRLLSNEVVVFNEGKAAACAELDRLTRAGAR